MSTSKVYSSLDYLYEIIIFFKKRVIDSAMKETELQIQLHVLVYNLNQMEKIINKAIAMMRGKSPRYEHIPVHLYYYKKYWPMYMCSFRIDSKTT